MNTDIYKMKYDNLLFFDIETVRGQEMMDAEDDRLHSWMWKMRDKDSSETPDISSALKMYQERAALYPEWGKIVCISVGYILDDKIVVTSLTGEEKDILLKFVAIVNNSGSRLVGHNVIAFDLPYIRKRFFINGLKDYLPEALGNDVYVKPWEMDKAVFDTMVAWKGSGYLNSSLEELTMVFGLPSPKNDLQGHEVSNAFYRGEINRIAKYCEGDVAAVANVVRMWKGDNPLPMKYKEIDEKEKSKNVLELISITDSFSSELQDELREKINSVKITKKDKENLERLLKGVYIKTDFISGDMDSKADVKAKEMQIKDFIDSL